MINPRRGDVALIVEGAERPMRLTLGALAALEARTGAKGLVGLAEAFESGGFSADDLIALLTAGLNGAGDDVSEAEVAAMAIDGGAVGAARAASELLAKAFGGEA